MNSRTETQRICLTDLWILVVLLIFTKPQIAEDIPILDILFNAGRFGLTIIYFILYFWRGKKLNKELLCLLGMFIAVLLATIINQGNIPKALTHYVPSIGLLSYVLYNKKKIRRIVICLVNLGLTLLTLNLITYLAFPDGLVYRADNYVYVWLLGQKQDLAGFIFPVLFVGCLKDFETKDKHKSFIRIYILSMITLVLEQSVAALICVALLGLLCLLDKYLSTRFSKKWLVAGSIIAFIAVQYIAFNFEDISGLQNSLALINTRGISKVRSLGTRFKMWRFAWDSFIRSPLWGVGELSIQSWINGVGFYHSIADNLFMDMLMTGGLVCVSLFLFLIKRSFSCIGKYNRYRSARYMNYILFVACLYSFTGSPFMPLLFMIFASSAWIPKYIDLVGEKTI